MVRAGCLLLLTLPLFPATDELVKPDKLPLSTWVREDIFAGWIANDPVTFEHGVRKVDRFLQDHPGSIDGLAWKFTVAAYRMRRAREKHDDAAYRRELALSKELRAKIFAGDPKDAGPYIIVGSSLVGLAYFAPAEDRDGMYRDGRDLLSKVPALQAQYFEQLPPHMRGELWSQIAFASDRLGDSAERDRVLNEMAAKLAGSPYEGRARSWKEGGLAKEKNFLCISCHEPGRLAPALARMQARQGQ